jgi:aryl carrier-like protein
VKRLVAYVVAAKQPPPTADELMSYLRERLPEYMYPAAFVVLDAMPLTPNGKIDRRALPRPEIQPRRRGYDAPTNEVEETLCGIWAQVLGVERVGTDDNFFELGGDSILCIQIVSRARQAGYNLAPVDLFEHQTVAALAEVIHTAAVHQPEPEPVEGDLPLVPIQQRFFDQGYANPHHFNQAVLLTARMALNAELLEAALGHLLQHHDALRFRFRHEDTHWRQIGSPNGDREAIQQFDLSDLPEL